MNGQNADVIITLTQMIFLQSSFLWFLCKQGCFYFICGSFHCSQYILILDSQSVTPDHFLSFRDVKRSLSV